MTPQEIIAYKDLMRNPPTKETLREKLPSPVSSPAYPLLHTLYEILPPALRHALHDTYREHLEGGAGEMDDMQLYALKIFAAPLHEVLHEAGEV